MQNSKQQRAFALRRTDAMAQPLRARQSAVITHMHRIYILTQSTVHQEL